MRQYLCLRLAGEPQVSQTGDMFPAVGNCDPRSTSPTSGPIRGLSRQVSERPQNRRERHNQV